MSAKLTVLEAIRKIEDLRKEAREIFSEVTKINSELGITRHQKGKIASQAKHKFILAGRAERSIESAVMNEKEYLEALKALSKYEGASIDEAKKKLIEDQKAKISEHEGWGEVLLLKTEGAQLADQENTLILDIQEKQALADEKAAKAKELHELANELMEEHGLKEK